MKKVISVLLLLSLIFVIGASGCGSNYGTTTTPPATTSSPPTTPSASGSSNIAIGGYAFNPSDITVNVGTTVTWTNNDPVGHQIVSDSAAFQSSVMNRGEKYSFTFENAGTYAYHCSIHPSMKGSVVVK